MTEESKAPLGTFFNAESAAHYVRSLFKYVLDRKAVGSDELNFWSDFLLKNQDPAEVLRLFAVSEENMMKKRSALEAGGFPPGHFYSPIVNVNEVTEDLARIFAPRELPELNLNLDGQEQLFRRIAVHSESLPFTDEPTEGHRYHYNNTSYGFGDAFVYWGIISEFKPERIIEIGSGYTSGLALDAIDVLGLRTACTFIDPYPDLLKMVAGTYEPKHILIEDRVQNLDPSIIDILGEDDILFIDSSHVVKTGSDVQFELFELLPRLRSGVIVHFHDVFYPFEYPKEWVVDERKSWNELYFLRSFLMYNNAFEIMFFNHCFAALRPNVLTEITEKAADRIRLNPGGGIWLKRA